MKAKNSTALPPRPPNSQREKLFPKLVMENQQHLKHGGECRDPQSQAGRHPPWSNSHSPNPSPTLDSPNPSQSTFHPYPSNLPQAYNYTNAQTSVIQRGLQGPPHPAPFYQYASGPPPFPTTQGQGFLHPPSTQIWHPAPSHNTFSSNPPTLTNVLHAPSTAMPRGQSQNTPSAVNPAYGRIPPWLPQSIEQQRANAKQYSTYAVSTEDRQILGVSPFASGKE